MTCNSCILQLQSLMLTSSSISSSKLTTSLDFIYSCVKISLIDILFPFGFCELLNSLLGGSTSSAKNQSSGPCDSCRPIIFDVLKKLIIQHCKLYNNGFYLKAFKILIKAFMQKNTNTTQKSSRIFLLKIF